MTTAPMVEIGHFDDLLRAARGMAEPQHLLFVFAAAELPSGASAQQRADFEAGVGGELAPLMCVDKVATELPGFDALVVEAAAAGPPWAIVFSAALSGRGGMPPTAADIDAAMQHMVDSIKAGRLDGMLPFDRQGLPVQLS
ncbi:MAG: ribonucleotide reductase subunit alpha [Rubrivivax sp.]|nr:ribonucleotide reductase subunit alpha [Rubrivivax sp.]